MGDFPGLSAQNLKAAFAQYQEARATLRYYRADYYPTITANPSATHQRYSNTRPPKTWIFDGITLDDFTVPLNLSAPAESPLPKPAPKAGYHGNPLLKPPSWTWQVPLYLFAGGVAGTSAFIALVAHVSGNSALLRAALWVALAGALISPPLLIADLGRPTRFLNMLRVFKLRSVMSIGAWTLAVFSSAIGLAVVCHELILSGYGYGFLQLVTWAAEVVAAFAGLILASYTSVLLSVTAIPVWSENRRVVPPVFLAGGLGSASAVLELLGFLILATQFIGIVASTVETTIAVLIEARDRYVDKPLREGVVGWLVRGGGILAGPVSLLLRIFWPLSPGVRIVAAFSFITGALISRYAWIAAGRVSSRDPQALFQIQRRPRTATPTT